MFGINLFQFISIKGKLLFLEISKSFSSCSIFSILLSALIIKFNIDSLSILLSNNSLVNQLKLILESIKFTQLKNFTIFVAIYFHLLSKSESFDINV